MTLPDPLVSVDWLAERLDDAGLVILDATLPPPGVTLVPDVYHRYRERHIPGALFFDIEAHSDRTTGLPHMLPTPESFAESMGALGIRENMTAVVYEQQTLFSAPRAWWMLRTMGMEEVYVLDGGLLAWMAADQPVHDEVKGRPRAVFHPRFHPERVRTLGDIRRIVLEGGQVVDARSAGRFAGHDPEPRPGLRSGHMPGAHNVPYTRLLGEDGHMKAPRALRELFEASELDLQHPITTTCGSGVTAAALALGLERAGARAVSLYDGSWAEYAQQPDAEIVTAPDPSAP